MELKPFRAEGVAQVTYLLSQRIRISFGKNPGVRFVARLLGRLAAVVVLATLPGRSEDTSPFTITPSLVTTNGATILSLSFHIPKDHHLYADELSFEIAGQPVTFKLPDPVRVQDKFSRAERGTFATDFTTTHLLSEVSDGLALTVNLRGCSEEECYFPETRQWTIRGDHSFARANEPPDAPTPAANNGSLTSDFEIVRRASGYLGKNEFLHFLAPTDGPSVGGGGGFAGLGVVATLSLILLGGLALNLTPCVLPMIPINLAILGAGISHGGRRRAFGLGSAYGAGMALAYGGLGLAVVLAGAKFGALNSSPIFNFAIAGVFLVLSLAMFDRFVLDFSRFQRRHGAPAATGAFLGAAMMGVLAALLAGACVAPVVLSVLLLAATSYQHGNVCGLLFPFVLGLGMALPWPFAAAGLSLLPKPGTWMTRVKHGFGILILAFAAWYGWLGWKLTDSAAPLASHRNGPTELRAALETSRRTGQPVFVDFWASWCKNCEAMEHTTFLDADVRAKLKNFLLVKFQADHLNAPENRPVLDELGVLGLPTYVVLRPVGSPKTVAIATEIPNP